MQQQSTPCPMQETNLKSPWGIFQKSSSGEFLRLWTNFHGKIEGISNNVENLITKIKASGGFLKEIPEYYLCFPTGIDLQVHLRFPGQASKETLEGGLNSALVGGYDAVLTMPNTYPYLDDAVILKQAIADCEKNRIRFSETRVLFTAAGTKGMQGIEAVNISALVQAGAVAITDDGWGVKSEEAMSAIFAACADCNVPFLQHAEMPGHKGVATASSFQKQAGLPEYPKLAESDMVKRDIALLRKHKKARYHVLHISTRETLEEIRKAKEEGLNITAEVTPHHLFFSNAEIPPESTAESTSFKMNPPLFSPEDREALQLALRDGLIDFVSTDHAPHEFSAKSQGWLKAPFGTRGMETALPVLVHLMGKGMLSKKRVEEVFSSVPRKFIGVTDVAQPKGLVFVDPTKAWTVGVNDLPGISKNSCFLGATLQARIEMRAGENVIYKRKAQ